MFLSRRSFSELYHKAIKDAECKPGEDQSGEAWVLDEREDEEATEDEQAEAGEIEEADAMEVQVTDTKGDEQPRDEGQSEGSRGSISSPHSLPLLRATSLQDHPSNQSRECSASQLTRSFSLERQPSFRETCDGYVVPPTLSHNCVHLIHTHSLFDMCF